jgi:[FeFe] hydrogenase H-cluster maturation GTPase HydF
LLLPNSVVVLVIPIDSSAPKGRLILPQQQVIRDVLEAGAVAVSTRETELVQTLVSLGKKPRLVITDSQAFEQVSRDTPADVLLTSFSILFARYKGSLQAQVHGAAQLDKLQGGDKILISEGCTHHRQCNDIGAVKMPNWVKNYTGKQLSFAFTSGAEFPEDLGEYSLVIHCGGCMLNEREIQHRIHNSISCGVPVTNYGVAIAQMHGVLKRSLSPFPDLLQELG